MKKIIMFSAIALSVIMPLAVLAGDFELPGGEAWTADRIAELLGNIADFLIGASMVMAVIVIIYVGILYFGQGFSTEAVKKAKDVFKNAIIGVAIVLGVGVIINTISVIVMGDFFG